MPVLWDSKVTFFSVSHFLGLVLCFPFGSVSEPFVTPCLNCLTWGKKKWGKKIGERKKIDLLLTLNPLNEFCLSSWMPQEEGGWASLFSLPMVWEDGDQVWAAIFTVAQPPAQVLCELPGSNQPLSLCAHSVIQAWVLVPFSHSFSGRMHFKSPLQRASLCVRVPHKPVACHS